MIVLKLGGSLLTYKGRKFSLRKKVLKRIASEVKAASQDLVIVHGGGSYGHPLAHEYRLNEGYIEKKQIKGIALTRFAMDRFNRAVVGAFIDAGLRAASLQTSAVASCEGGEIKNFNINVVRGFLALGVTPVLYGDVALDSEKGFCILSGDKIVVYLCKALDADRVVLAIDKDGVYDRDPGLHRGARLYREINRANYGEVLSKLSVAEGDVTGGIRGKLEELWSLAEEGKEALIVNGLVPGRLQKALLGEEVKGTRIRVD